MPSILLTAVIASVVAVLQPEDQRPQAPAAPVIVAISEADCQDSQRRAALLAEMDAVIEQPGRDGEALNQYNERLMDWRNARLIRAGRWTEEDKARFVLALLQDPEFATPAQAGMALAQQVLPPAVIAGDEDKPPLERCRSLMRLQAIFGDILRAVRQQWSVADARYGAEGRRLGIALD